VYVLDGGGPNYGIFCGRNEVTNLAFRFIALWCVSPGEIRGNIRLASEVLYVRLVSADDG
jgi:hypothetical protein